MLMAAATRRASCRSSIEQQLPNEVCPSLWSYSCIDSPMTSCPCSSSSAAATDESTPPDMATTIRMDPKSKCEHERHERYERHENTKDMTKNSFSFVYFVGFLFSCVSWVRWSHRHR